MPHDLQRTDGRIIPGTSHVVLCADCDADHPTGGPLITYFHVHGVITEDTLTEVADLIGSWANSICIPPPNIEQIDAEADAWYRGEL